MIYHDENYCCDESGGEKYYVREVFQNHKVT